jgi:hypothetical protein
LLPTFDPELYDGTLAKGLSNSHIFGGSFDCSCWAVSSILCTVVRSGILLDLDARESNVGKSMANNRWFWLTLYNGYLCVRSCNSEELVSPFIALVAAPTILVALVVGRQVI